MKKVLLIINPCSGKMKSKTALFDIARVFSSKGYDVSVKITEAQKDAERFAEKAKCDTIVCCGGDGTLSEVLNGALRQKNPPAIGYVPAGTTNDFAQSIGLEFTPSKAAKAIAEGKERDFDAGLFCDRKFMYVASFGLFTESSYTTPQTQKNTLGHFAYILEGIRELSSIKSYRMKIECNDRVFEGDYIFGAVSNSTSIGGIMKLDSRIVKFNDGVLELMLIKSPKNPIDLTKILYCLNNQVYDENYVQFVQTEKIKITTQTPPSWSLDGEFVAGAEEINIEVIPKAFRMIF